MATGQCPTCARPFTPGEVAGLGILRSRPAIRGGPLVEFACPGCGRLLRLVPHGGGRYAAPGEPPPPEVPEAARRPPWATDAAASSEAPPEPPRRARAPRTPPPPSPEEPPPHRPGPRPDPVRDLTWALERLGVGPEADGATIDRAYRERSRSCHPDKVAHLDPDFQALAEKKFRELREAYDLLTGRAPPSRNS